MNQINKITPKFWLLTMIVVLVVLARLIPHEPNFTPLGAIALFAGAYFVNRTWALLVPLAALFLSDFALQIGFWLGWREFEGFYTIMPAVYLGIALMVGMGYWLKDQVNVKNVFGASIAGGLVFFILTNFAVWLAWMPYTWEGLVQCYAQAIPFFRNTLVSNLLYSALLFGSFEWMKAYYPKWVLQQ